MALEAAKAPSAATLSSFTLPIARPRRPHYRHQQLNLFLRRMAAPRIARVVAAWNQQAAAVRGRTKGATAKRTEKWTVRYPYLCARAYPPTFLWREAAAGATARKMMTPSFPVHLPPETNRYFGKRINGRDLSSLSMMQEVAEIS